MFLNPVDLEGMCMKHIYLHLRKRLVAKRSYNLSVSGVLSELRRG